MKKVWIFIILFIFLLPAVYPLLRGDFFHFSDEPNISLIYEMSRAIKASHFPPRWIPDVSYNYGYPLFNFYYILPFFLGAIIFQLVGSLISTVKIYFLLTVMVSCWAMFLLLKKHTSLFLAFVGAILYVYTPYRAVDLYVRGAIGELTAFALVPLVCLFIYNLYEKQSLKNIGLLGLLTAAFILSHNLALIIFFPWFLIYGLYLFLKNPKNMKFVKAFVISIILGVLLSFFWLFPAINEKHLLSSQTPFDYKDHFPFLKQLVYSPFRYGASQPGPYDDISLQIGIANILLVLVAIKSFIFASKKTKLLAFFCLVAFTISIFLMNIRSSFLWEAFSLSTYFQFPWRILMFTTFLTVFMIVFLKSRIMGLILLFIAFTNTFSYFVPSEYFNPDDNYYLRRFFANATLSIGDMPYVSPDYKNYSEDYLLLPIWVKEKPDSLPSEKIESDTAQVSLINEISPYEYQSEVLSEKNSEIRVNNFYYPGWNVYIDNEKVETYPLDPNGNIGFKVGSGDHNLKVIWEETSSRRLANYVSLLSLVIALALVFAITEKVKRKRK